MARRDHFDDGHGMDHHKALKKAVRLGTGALLGASMIGGPVGALAGAAAFHVADKIYDSKSSNEEDDF